MQGFRAYLNPKPHKTRSLQKAATSQMLWPAFIRFPLVGDDGPSHWYGVVQDFSGLALEAVQTNECIMCNTNFFVFPIQALTFVALNGTLFEFAGTGSHLLIASREWRNASGHYYTSAFHHMS